MGLGPNFATSNSPAKSAGPSFCLCVYDAGAWHDPGDDDPWLSMEREIAVPYGSPGCVIDVYGGLTSGSSDKINYFIWISLQLGLRKDPKSAASVREYSSSKQQHLVAHSAGLKLVPGGGVEPPRPEGRRILSPLRLPVPPSRHFVGGINFKDCSLLLFLFLQNNKCETVQQSVGTLRICTAQLHFADAMK